MPNIRVGIPQG